VGDEEACSSEDSTFVELVDFFVGEVFGADFFVLARLAGVVGSILMSASEVLRLRDGFEGDATGSVLIFLAEAGEGAVSALLAERVALIVAMLRGGRMWIGLEKREVLRNRLILLMIMVANMMAVYVYAWFEMR
jgi:hypothetical protein